MDIMKEIKELYKLIPQQLIDPRMHPKALVEIANVLEKVSDHLVEIEIELDYLVEDEKEEYKDVLKSLQKISDDLIETSAKYETIFDL